MLAENFILHAIAAARAGGQNVIFSRAHCTPLSRYRCEGIFGRFPGHFNLLNQGVSVNEVSSSSAKNNLEESTENLAN